jgi:hypothetical protein
MHQTIKHALWGLSIILLTAPAQAINVVSSQAVLDRFFGVNLHLNNCCNGHYTSTTQVISELQYIGATHLRDGPIPMGGLLERWQTIRAATGAPFHGVIEMGSPARQRACMAVIKDWLSTSPGLMNIVEGGNEEDTTPAKQQGATLADTAALQSELYAIGKAAGVKVTQLSVGANWIPPLWEGNYKNFGTPPADYGNAHVYSNLGEVPSTSLQRIGALAAWSVKGKPVDVTEYGIFRRAQQSEALTSAYMHIAPFSSYLAGHAQLAIYALHDDSTTAIGFYDAYGKPRAHVGYWHATTRLMADPNGHALQPKEMAITFTDQRTVGKGASGIKNVPMYKSNGSLWVAVYDEEKPGVVDGFETITFDKAYPFIQLIDARTGATLQTLTNINKISVRLPANQLYFVVATNQKVAVKL